MRAKSCLLFWVFSFLFLTPLAASEAPHALLVTDNGREMLEWDIDFLRHATQSVEIGACYLGGDVARQLLQEVEKRLLEVPTLQVFILTTPVLLEKEDALFLDRLEKRFPYNFHLQHATNILKVLPELAGTDNHVKMFVVDEKYFSMGGTNLEEASCSEGTSTPPKKVRKEGGVGSILPAGMRDQDVVGRGRLAHDLRRIFYKLYALWEHYNSTGRFEEDPEMFATRNRYFKVTADPLVERFEKASHKRELQEGEVKLLLGGPYQKGSAITQEYVRLIQGAQKEISIANLYFCPAEPILQALMEAVNRGVKLTVLTNGISDRAPDYTQYFCWANRVHYVPMFYGAQYKLFEGGAVEKKIAKNTRVFEYHVKDILLHKKMMLVDDKTFLVGSYNLGLRSDRFDYELALVINNAQIAADAKKVHLKDLHHSRQVSAKEAREWYFDPVKLYMGELQCKFHGLF